MQWTVQEGETCGDIAAALYGSAEQRGLVERYNRVDCGTGSALLAGQTLVLPEHATASPPARLQAFTPYTQARPPGGTWRPATSGMALHRNYSVNTLTGARADVVFEDATIMVLGEDTLVVIFGTARESLVAHTTSAIELDEGEVWAGISALRGEPAQVAVRGGGAVTAASRDTVVRRKAQRSTVSVFEGVARVTSAGHEVRVPSRFGTSFADEEPPTAPRPLPAAPAWRSPSSDGVVLVAERAGALLAAWDAVAGATRYRVELAEDADFRKLLLRREVPSTVTSLRAERLAPGRYFVRVRAIDADDFLGLPSPDREVLLVEGRFVGAAGRIRGREIVVSPYATLVLTSPAGIELAQDTSAFRPAPATLDLALHTPRTLRLRSGGTTHESRYAIRYLEPEARVTAVRQARGHLRVLVDLTSLAGADPVATVRPHLRVQAGGSTTDVPLAGAGNRLGASFDPRSARTVRLDVVDGAGRLLGTETVDTRTGAPVAALPHVAPAPREGIAGATAPPVPTAPSTSVAWWSPTQANAGVLTAAAETDGAGRSGQLQGRAGGQLGAFGIDLRIASDGLAGAASTDSSAWLGTTWRAMKGASVTAGPALRAGVPVSDASPPTRLETGLAIASTAGHHSWVVDIGGRAAVGPLGTRTPAPVAQGFVVGGGAVDLASWVRGYALLDLHLVNTGSIHGQGGLSFGAEAGRAFFGGLALRLAPWDEGGGRTLLQCAVGVRH